MPRINPDNPDELLDLINSPRHKEHQCRLFLKHAKYLLMHQPIDFRFVETERQGYLGRSDYVISGTEMNGGMHCIRAYIWELKSPQSYIFERDRKNRLKPSKALIDAENKLLNYYLEHKYNGAFHTQYQLTHPAERNVCLGGIIIGSNRTLVKGVEDPIQRAQDYTLAFNARSFFYDPAKMMLKTWDEILEHIRTPQRTLNQQYIGTQTEIQVTAVQPNTIVTDQ